MMFSVGNWLHALGRMLRRGPSQTAWEWRDRYATYELWDAYYSNQIYETTDNGGQRANVNLALGNASAEDLAGIYNPVAQAVDLYASVFKGAFGDEIRVEAIEPATSALTDAINRIWAWSNLTVQKQTMCRLAATHGLCGLRIVAQENKEDQTRSRVYIKPEHPKTIRDMRLDNRGNITDIQLEYDVTVGLAEGAKTLCIREQMSREAFQTWLIRGGEPTPFDLAAFVAAGSPVDGVDRFLNGDGASYPNALGVVPYVPLYHELSGDDWGKNAFYKARTPLDRVNSQISHVDVEIHRHVRATWLIAASGQPPQKFTFDDLNVVYVDTSKATTAPLAQALVADLNLAGALGQEQFQIDLIEDMLPELKATGGKFLSGQSGETIAELRKPAEEKLGVARDNYEDALVRAQKIAVSWGIMLSLWDVGTGTGDREAADRAYQEGFEDHRFNKRPLLQLGDAMPAQPQQGKAQPAVEKPAVEPPVEEKATPVTNGKVPVDEPLPNA